MMKNNSIKPPKLMIGDTVGIVAPASAIYPAMESYLHLGIMNLLRLGLKIKFAEHALKYESELSNSASQRADDLNSMFGDPEVKAILCLCGGFSETVCDVIELLDWTLIEKNPKIVIGYSANTILLLGIYSRTNIVTFHGPHLLNEWSEFPEPLPYTVDSFKRLLFNDDAAGNLSPPEEWTYDFPKLDSPRKMNLNQGWRWLRNGYAYGQLLGGNLASISTLLLSDFPSFKQKILFIEEVYMGESIRDGATESLKMLKKFGVFEQISGLIVGKVNEPAEEAKFLELIIKYTEEYNFPILTHVDLGHTDPKIILPLGIYATLNSEKNIFNIDEPAVI